MSTALDAGSALRGQLKQIHDITEQAVADLSPAQLHHRGEGWTIQSIAVIYAHALMVEDSLLNGVLRAQPTLFEEAGWSAKIGIGMPDDHNAWMHDVSKVDTGALRQYAEHVYAQTDDYVGSLSAADLDRTVDTGFMGEMTAGTFIGSVIAWHATHHGGEICALKGVMGGKGLPF